MGSGCECGLYLAAPKTDQKPDASGRRVMNASAKMQPDRKARRRYRMCVCVCVLLAKMVTMAAIIHSHSPPPPAPHRGLNMFGCTTRLRLSISCLPCAPQHFSFFYVSFIFITSPKIPKIRKRRKPS